jgi:hypothetical protein
VEAGVQLQVIFHGRSGRVRWLTRWAVVCIYPLN